MAWRVCTAVTALGLLIAMALAVRVAGAQVPSVPTVTVEPRDPKLTVRVGEAAQFRIGLPGEAIVWRWTLDGRPVAAGREWTFVPSVDDIGRHDVAVAATGPSGTMHRRWLVRVTEPRAPRVVRVTPDTAALSVAANVPLRLQLDAVPAGRGETVEIQWTLDGLPAGEGDTLRFRPAVPGVVHARAVATGSLGAAVSREWRITVTGSPPTAAVTTTTLQQTARREEAPPDDVPLEAPPTTITRATTTSTTAPRPTTTSTPPRPTTTTVPTLRTTTVPPRPSTTMPPPATPPRPTTTTPPPPAAEPPLGPDDERLAARPPATARLADAIDERAVRGLLDRYAAAWRARDVGELRRLGQVTSDAQAAALREYFDEVGELDVQVEVLDVVPRGDRATVRFRRRDRFRNPAGQLTTQQSPPIEKQVVRGPDGRLRFGAAR